ncbi:MAG: hypothetical protein V3V08_13150 [Nannocystaceae bacterium]
MGRALYAARKPSKSRIKIETSNPDIKKLENITSQHDRHKYTMRLALKERKAIALEAYVYCGTVTAACAILGFTPSWWEKWQQQDEDFRFAADNAMKAVADNLEQEAIARAYDGSDILLMFLLKGHKPEKFLERQETNINVNSDIIRKFFERAASQPLGPPAITNDLGGLVVETE